LAASTDYLFLQSLSNKMTVVKKSDMSYVTHIEDDTYLDNAIRSFVSSRKLYVACQDIDAMTIVDVSDYTPIPPPVSGFIPRVMII